jgi:WD40 repeat protein
MGNENSNPGSDTESNEKGMRTDQTRKPETFEEYQAMMETEKKVAKPPKSHVPNANHARHQRSESAPLAQSVFPNLAGFRQIAAVLEDGDDSAPSSYAEVNCESLDIFQQRFVKAVSRLCSIPVELACVVLDFLKISGFPMAIIRGHRGPITAFTVLPNGWLASGSADCTIRFFNSDTGMCEAGWSAHHTSVISLAVVVKAHRRPRTRDWQLASGSAGGNLKIWDFDDRGNSDCVRSIDSTSSISCLTEYKPGFLACGADDGEVSVWDLENDEHKVLGKHASKVNDLRPIHDGLLVSCSKDGSVVVWDPAAFFQPVVHTLTGHRGPVSGVGILGENTNSKLVSVSWDKTAKLWDIGGPRLVGTFKIDMVSCMATLPDGRIACGSVDGCVRVWDPISGRCHATLRGHKLGVRALTMLPNHRLASGNACAI